MKLTAWIVEMINQHYESAEMIDNPMARPLTRNEEIMLYGDEKEWRYARDAAFDDLTDDPDNVLYGQECGEYLDESATIGRLIMLAVDDLRQYEEGRSKTADERAQDILAAARAMAEKLVENRAIWHLNKE